MARLPSLSTDLKAVAVELNVVELELAKIA